jgi:sporulation protein YlmC with PRC-barrel domain
LQTQREAFGSFEWHAKCNGREMLISHHFSSGGLPMPTIAPRVLSASTINGDAVHNPQGEDLGHIKDLMIDVATGRVAYAVLSFGGFLGLGDKLFAVPFQALELDARNECFKLDIDKERLKHAHGFDKDNWPDMADQRWQTEVHGVYGVEPYWN